MFFIASVKRYWGLVVAFELVEISLLGGFRVGIRCMTVSEWLNTAGGETLVVDLNLSDESSVGDETLVVDLNLSNVEPNVGDEYFV